MNPKEYENLEKVRVDEFTNMEFMQKVIELARLGFEPDYMTLRVIGRNRIIFMMNPNYVAPVVEEPEQEVVEPEQAPVEEPEQEVVESTTFSKEKMESITSKDELEAYGKEFGVDLNKAKKLTNMQKDLLAHVSE